MDDETPTPAEPEPEPAAAEPAAVEPAAASAVDQDGDTVERDLVELGVRYEQVRQARTDAGRSERGYKSELSSLTREFLTAMIDSGLASVSLIMPGSAENRVLTPQSTVLPKIRRDPEQPVDTVTGEPPPYSLQTRIAALRAAGLGHLVVEKIDDTALREVFESYIDEDAMPDALRKVYGITRTWAISSTKGRAGRMRPPTAAEIAEGR